MPAHCGKLRGTWMIILRALKKQPEERLCDGQRFAKTVKRYLPQPVCAQPDSVWYESAVHGRTDFSRCGGRYDTHRQLID